MPCRLPEIGKNAGTLPHIPAGFPFRVVPFVFFISRKIRDTHRILIDHMVWFRIEPEKLRFVTERCFSRPSRVVIPHDQVSFDPVKFIQHADRKPVDHEAAPPAVKRPVRFQYPVALRHPLFTPCQVFLLRAECEVKFPFHAEIGRIGNHKVNTFGRKPLQDIHAVRCLHPVFHCLKLFPVHAALLSLQLFFNFLFNLFLQFFDAFFLLP